MHCIVDSSIWIAFLVDDDNQHEKAKQVFAHLEKDNTVVTVPEYILLEVYTKVMLLRDLATAQNFLKFVKHHSEYFPMRYFSTQEMMLFHEFILENAQEKLSYVDMALLYFSKEYKIYTFDRELEKYIYQINRKE